MSELEQFAADCCKSVEWDQAFLAYEWQGSDYREGLHARAHLHGKLVEGLQATTAEDPIDEITAWGWVPPLRGAALKATIASLHLLERSGTTVRSDAALYAQRIATVSKVYAMYDPESWAIYDSRVAWALEALRDRVDSQAEVEPFVQPPARSAPPYPGSPSIHSERRARESFLRASALARGIASKLHLTCPDVGGWTTAHIEMALFAMGGAANRERGFMSEGVKKSVGDSKKVTPTGMAKGALIKAAKSDVVKNTLEDQVKTLLDLQFAKVRAMRFARETDSVTAQAQFADGVQRWVIFREEVPIASFPGFGGDLEEALRFHNYDRLQMRKPNDLAKEIEADREDRKNRWKIWARDDDDEQERVVEEMLQLEAGPTPSD